MNFGEELRRLRLDRGFTLREFCKKSGLDPSEVSRLERRTMLPPESYTVWFKDLVAHLYLTGEEANYLGELATKARKTMEKKPLTDDELVKHLPVLLHSRLDCVELNKLIEMIRKEASPIY